MRKRFSTHFNIIFGLMIIGIQNGTVFSQVPFQETSNLHFSLPTTQPIKVIADSPETGLIYKESHLPTDEIIKSDNHPVDTYTGSMASQRLDHSNIKLTEPKYFIFKQLVIPKYDFPYSPFHSGSAIFRNNWPCDNWDKPFQPSISLEYRRLIDQLKLEMKYQSTKFDLIDTRKLDLPKRDR